MSSTKQIKNSIQLEYAGLTRRDFLAAMGASVTGVTLSQISEAANRKNHPNILFIMVDDLGKE